MTVVVSSVGVPRSSRSKVTVALAIATALVCLTWAKAHLLPHGILCWRAGRWEVQLQRHSSQASGPVSTMYSESTTRMSKRYMMMTEVPVEELPVRKGRIEASTPTFPSSMTRAAHQRYRMHCAAYSCVVGVIVPMEHSLPMGIREVSKGVPVIFGSKVSTTL